MLMRVDICAAEGGVLVVNVSHEAAGFAPYRLDNCSSQTLHIRQETQHASTAGSGFTLITIIPHKGIQ
jgi:hypothetical protein